MIYLLPLITTAFWYLGSLASLTEVPRQWIADHLPRLHLFLDCPACSGTWYGFAFGAWFTRDVVGTLCLGAASMVWTPLIGALLVVALHRIGETFDV